MQSENIDNKIRQAAEQHHPDYDEKAWNKMEKLLDRHLPKKDDRRRRVIFFVLLFLVMGGGAWLIISKPWRPGNQTLTVTNTPVNPGTKPATISDPARTGTSSYVDKIDKETSATPGVEPGEKDIQTKTVVSEAGQPNRAPGDNIGRITGQRTQRESPATDRVNKSEEVSVEINDPGKAKKNTHISGDNTSISTTLNRTNDKLPATGKDKPTVDVPVNNNQPIAKATETTKDNITEQVKKDEQKAPAKKMTGKKTNTFFFSLSLAPDISSIGFDNPGKLRLLTGAGFGYTFKDRLTLRTGFYSGHKVYSATRDNYKPTVTPPNSQYIDNIAADCKVYEIPLNISYNLSQSKRHNWFAAAGLSSFIMKKENYVYLYKYPNGSSWSYTKTIHDEYRHYFSVLTLSAGYQRKINRTFSVSAEPYVKLPLAGVGYGKVKLNSVGVMFSLNISPFQSSVKK